MAVQLREVLHSLFKQYNSRCPSNRPDNALYLKPLSTPKGHIWYSKVPLGHNLLQNTVSHLMKSVNYTGYYTNHSLRASAATRLFTSSVDEQAIMSVTGHSSTDGVRAYKCMSEKLREVTSDVVKHDVQVMSWWLTTFHDYGQPMLMVMCDPPEIWKTGSIDNFEALSEALSLSLLSIKIQIVTCYKCKMQLGSLKWRLRSETL